MWHKLQQDFSYSSNFLKKILELMSISKVVAFGDSHVQLFEDCDEIEVNHVGASTACNLAEHDSSTRGRRNVLSRLSCMNSDSEAVLLCFELTSGLTSSSIAIKRDCQLTNVWRA